MEQIRRAAMAPCHKSRPNLRRSRRPAHAPLRTHPTRSRPPGPPMMKPCIDCGTPTNGTRCPQHAAPVRAAAQRQHQQRRNMRGGRKTRGGGGRGQPPPGTLCWICHHPATETDPLQWDHLHPIAEGGDQGGPVAPAHRSCNIQRSNRRRARARATHQRAERQRRLTRNQ